MGLNAAYNALDGKDKFAVGLATLTLLAGTVFSALGWLEARSENESARKTYEAAIAETMPRYDVLFKFGIKRNDSWSWTVTHRNSPAKIARADLLARSSHLTMVLTNPGDQALVVYDIGLLTPKKDKPANGFWISNQKYTQDCANASETVRSVTCYTFPIVIKSGEQRTVHYPLTLNGKDLLEEGATHPIRVGIHSNTPEGFHNWNTYLDAT